MQQTDKIKIIGIFDKYAESYSAKYMDLKEYKTPLIKFADLLPDNASILDAACGPGNVIQFLKDMHPSYRFVGLDLAKNMLQIAQDSHPEFSFYLDDICSTKAFNERYNGIILSFILPYLSIQEVTEILKKCYNSLYNNGLLYISTMVSENTEYIETNSSDGSESMTMHYYDKTTLKTLLNTAKFTIHELYDLKNADVNGNGEDCIIIAKK